MNVNAPILILRHADLRAVDDSAYRVECPACHVGMLMVSRNQKTQALLRDDRCIGCGQRVRYTDEAIGGERLPP